MFIGHIPSGYIWTRFCLNRCQKSFNFGEKSLRRFMFWGLTASVLPDIDMFYFYVIDNHQHLHHSYWTHIPLFWIALFLISFLVAWVIKKGEWVFLFFIIFSNIFLHLFLDTIAGKIRWLYPLSRHDFVFVTVPARYHWAYWNFIFHWTFLLELVVTSWAIILYIQFQKKRNAQPVWIDTTCRE
jgi:inner membrane protein